MPPKKDYYSDWLGIPPGTRPPDHYALLGLPRWETDATKISEAAAARLRLVRQYGLKFPKESTDLLNEIAAAEVCLLDAGAKAKYDQSLRAGAGRAEVFPVTPVAVSWYLQRDNQVYGPFPEHQLHEMAKGGYLAASDLVWNEQIGQWTPASTIEGLVFRDQPAAGASQASPVGAEESRSSSALLDHARRLIPYALGATTVTPGERAALTAAGVTDSTQGKYLAWRRTTLYLIAALSAFAALWASGTGVFEAEMMPANWFGAVVKTFRALALFALPISAIIAAAFWANLTVSRGALLAGWLLATAIPLAVGLIPFQYQVGPDQEIEFPGGRIQLCRLLAVALALTPAAIRGALWLKSMRPASTVASWSIVACALLHVPFYAVVLAMLCQMIGNGFLSAAALFLILAPLGYAIGYRTLLETAPPQATRAVLLLRGIHLLIAGVGLVLLALFLLTKTFDSEGHLRLAGIDPLTALLRPGSLLQIFLEFLARSFFGSFVALDLLEIIHRSMIKTTKDNRVAG